MHQYISQRNIEKKKKKWIKNERKFAKQSGDARNCFRFDGIELSF